MPCAELVVAVGGRLLGLRFDQPGHAFGVALGGEGGGDAAAAGQ
jgi:hypothetical protein